jgi:lipopolysaccharide transport system ATP-binding protein
VGAGVHPDLPGRENVFICGLVAGLTRHEIARRFEAIVTFAELEAFIDNPLRNYSTGMQMRLAFAVAVHTDPAILLIDEVLAVGDIAFQEKCMERIRQFKEQGCAMLLVSHDPSQIAQLCDRALWLRNGELAAYGDPAMIREQYETEMSKETRQRTPEKQLARQTSAGTVLKVNENRFGSLEMEITGVRLLDSNSRVVAEIRSGDSLKVEIEYFAPEAIEAPIFGVTISNDNKPDILFLDVSTEATNFSVPALNGRGCVTLDLKRLDLENGKYFIDIGVYERNWAYAYDYHWHAYPIMIRAKESGKGILFPPHRWEINGVQAPHHNSLPVAVMPES